MLGATLGTMSAMVRWYYRQMPPVKRIGREIATSPDGRDFEISTISCLGVHTQFHMLVARLGRGRRLYQTADQFTVGQHAYEAYVGGIEDHLACVEALKQEAPALDRQHIRFTRPANRELPIDNELGVRKDIVIGRAGNVYRVSTAEVVLPVYLDETLVRELRDDTTVFNSRCRGLHLQAELARRLRVGDYSMVGKN